MGGEGAPDVVSVTINATEDDLHTINTALAGLRRITTPGQIRIRIEVEARSDDGEIDQIAFQNNVRQHLEDDEDVSFRELDASIGCEEKRDRPGGSAVGIGDVKQALEWASIPTPRGGAPFWRYNEAMPSVQIKNVPPDVHRVLRQRAATAGQSLQEYLLTQLKQQANEETLDEILDRAGDRAGGSLGLAFAAETLRDERKRAA